MDSQIEIESRKTADPDGSAGFLHRYFGCPAGTPFLFFRELRSGNVKIQAKGIRRYAMETRIAVIAIIVEDRERSEEINQLLHEYGEYIVGRMGVPYREKKLSIISVILDAPQEKISALSGKLGMIPGISSKTLYSKFGEKIS